MAFFPQIYSSNSYLIASIDTAPRPSMNNGVKWISFWRKTCVITLCFFENPTGWTGDYFTIVNAQHYTQFMLRLYFPGSCGGGPVIQDNWRVTWQKNRRWAFQFTNFFKGWIETAKFSILFLVFVPGPPTASHHRSKQIVLVGSNVRLQCPMSGHPNPMIDWTKDKEGIIDYSWTRSGY